MGVTYDFNVEAQNSIGYGAASESLTLLHAMVPEKPALPTVQNSGQDVILTWSAPYDNGTPITYYTILIKQADNTFSQETANCDGT